MPGMQIFIDDGDTPKIVANRLEASGAAVESLDEVFQQMLWDAMDITEVNIRSEGRRGGGSYQQLSPLTQERKGMGAILYTVGARAGYTDIGDDALVRSVTEEGSQFHIGGHSRDGFYLGTDRPYARTHQFGASRSKGGNVPARPFLRYLQSDVDKWNAWIANHLLEVFRKTNE